MMLKRLSRDRFCGLFPITAVAMSLVACGAEDIQVEDSNPESTSGVHLVVYQPQPDGTLEPVEQTLTLEDFKAMHERRLAHMQQDQSEVGVAQQGLTYRGAGESYYPISACDDDRTTWMFSVPDGWDINSWQNGGWLGCVGAAVGGSDWTGTLELSTLTYGSGWFLYNWRDGMYSFWVSNSYSMQLCTGDRPRVCTFPYAPWSLGNHSGTQYLTMM